MTTFFIYDVYIPLLLIGIAWLLVLVAKILEKYCDSNFKSYRAKFFSILHKLH